MLWVNLELFIIYILDEIYTCDNIGKPYDKNNNALEEEVL
jgi:hypothetical protein